MLGILFHITYKYYCIFCNYKFKNDKLLCGPQNCVPIQNEIEVLLYNLGLNIKCANLANFFKILFCQENIFQKKSGNLVIGRFGIAVIAVIPELTVAGLGDTFSYAF